MFIHKWMCAAHFNFIIGAFQNSFTRNILEIYKPLIMPHWKSYPKARVFTCCRRSLFSRSVCKAYRLLLFRTFLVLSQLCHCLGQNRSILRGDTHALPPAIRLWRQWILRNWNFLRGLMLGEGKKWPLLPVRGETCSPDFTQLQLDRRLGVFLLFGYLVLLWTIEFKPLGSVPRSRLAAFADFSSWVFKEGVVGNF